METLFIKKVVNYELFNKRPSIVLDGLFSLNNKQEQLITFTENNDNEDYEFILNIENIDKTDLNEDEEKERNNFITCINDEITKTANIMKYLIANIDLHKINVRHYKIYDYSNTPNHLKRKIKPHNHIFDAKKFIIKNCIDKTKMNTIISQITLSTSNENNELKLMAYFIISKIIDFYNTYNKCLLYSLEILKEHPYIIRYKDDYLVSINPTYFTQKDDTITIAHHNNIKNAFIKVDTTDNSNNNSKSTLINISKNKNNNYEINF